MALRPNVARLRDLLLKSKLVDEFQMRAAMGRLEQWGGRLTGIIVDLGFVDDEAMVQALSQAMRIPVMHLGMVVKDQALLSKVDPVWCQEHGVFPVSLQNRVVTLAMSDPTEVDAVDYVQQRVGARVQVVVAPEGEIRAAIAKHYYGQSVPATRRPPTSAKDAHIESTRGEVFELDTSSPPKPGEGPTAAPNASDGWLGRAPSANTLLDDFLDDAPAEKADGLSAEELKRLESAVANQAKTGAILQALNTLLREKGYLS